MDGIKRILWIDDYADNLDEAVRNMFPDAETKKVSSLDDAINVISKEHLYDYDTIILDIDFENGVKNGQDVINKLSQRIYLSKDQKNNQFIINNGGYLLFLYLLERGYPSEQIAFLTGNGGIISQLQVYSELNKKEMSKEEIVEAFTQAWSDTGAEQFDDFLRRIESLPIDRKYKDEDFMYECAEALDENNQERLNELIQQIEPTLVTGTIKNTGDKMIFRFHEANLEAPVYFSKNVNDIPGHNREDANKWLKEKRTPERVARWLMLFIGDYIETMFRKNLDSMNNQIGNVLSNIVYDGGIRSAYRQMYYVFDGLKERNKGVYYQAISALLIPYDATPKNSMNHAFDVIKDNPSQNQIDLCVRRMFACCSKQGRNYCAHNYFGTEVTDNTTMLLAVLATTCVLTRDQRNEIDEWYQYIFQICNKQVIEASQVDKNIVKIEDIMSNLLQSNSIDKNSAKVDDNYADYTARNYLYALGYNTAIKGVAQRMLKEEYFMFSLSAYIVKWFDRMDCGSIERLFGKQVLGVYYLAHNIVEAYNYPSEL